MSTVVVYRALGLGDFLTGLPALRAVGAAFPDDRLLLAAPAPLRPLLDLSGTGARLVATRPFESLVMAPPALAVNLHGRGPQSHAVLRALRPRRLIAFAPPEPDRDTSAGPSPGRDASAGPSPGRDASAGPSPGRSFWREEEHEITRWCRLLDESGIPAEPARLELDREIARSWPARSALGVDPEGATVIHAGAASGARRWPPARFAAVARAEVAAGRRVLLTGSGDERDAAEEVAARAGLGPDAVLAGRTDLRGLAAIVAASARVVCGDTGVAHLATALGVPSVVLFGPTSPSRWGPPPGRGPHIVLWAGAHGDPHASDTHEGLLRIGVEAVVAALAQLDREQAAEQRRSG